MVRPDQDCCREALAILRQFALDVPRVTVFALDSDTRDFVDQNRAVVEYLAYFMKENLVWTNVLDPSKLVGRSSTEAAMLGLLEFLDSAPWLSGVAPYRDRWAAVEFLVAAKFIVHRVTSNMFSLSSRSNERILVPHFRLQSNPADLPPEVAQRLLKFAVTDQEARRRRQGLLEDLGPAAPQVGPRNTARVLDPENLMPPIIIRQVMYSGRTVQYYELPDGTKGKLEHKELIERYGEQLTIKLLILSPSAVKPYDEGTWNDGADRPGEILRLNLLKGLCSLRLLNLPNRKMKRLQVRFFGDKLEHGLFRGIIMSGRDGPTAAQFCVWELMEQRGTHGEYGQTNGATNLAKIFTWYFDKVFEEAIPIYKRHLLGWLFRGMGWETAVAFSLFGVSLFLFLEFSDFKARPVSVNWDALYGALGFLLLVLSKGKDLFVRAKRMRVSDKGEWVKFFPKWMKRHIEAEETRRMIEEGSTDVSEGSVSFPSAPALVANVPEVSNTPTFTAVPIWARY